MPTISRTLLRSACVAGLVSLAFPAGGQTPAGTPRIDKGKTMHVTSRDGTRIAYDKWGKGQ